MKEGQVYKIKEGQETAGLPAEVTISRIEGESIFIASPEGVWESTEEVIETFYTIKEEFNLVNMPKLAIEAIDEAISLMEIFVSTQNPLAGLTVKTKLLALKENISKVSGIKSIVPDSLLGKKIL